MEKNERSSSNHKGVRLKRKRNQSSNKEGELSLQVIRKGGWV